MKWYRFQEASEIASFNEQFYWHDSFIKNIIHLFPTDGSQNCSLRIILVDGDQKTWEFIFVHVITTMFNGEYELSPLEITNLKYDSQKTFDFSTFSVTSQDVYCRDLKKNKTNYFPYLEFRNPYNSDGCLDLDAYSDYEAFY